MSQYPFDDPKPRKGNNAWFYVALVLVAAVVGGLFMRYMWPAMQQPSGEPQTSISPTPTSQAAETTTTTAAQQGAKDEAKNDGTLINGNVELAEDASIPDMIEAVGPAVVGISNRAVIAGQSGIVGSINGIPVPGTDDSSEGEETEQGYGSGVIISTDGYIVTNAHVVDDASKLVVILGGGEEVEAQLVGKDETTDLALLKIDKEGLTAITLGDSDSVRVGETTLAIGNPMGQELYGSVSKGIISATNRQITMDSHVYTMLQTDTAINPGNSGGALVNLKGELIGIASAKTVTTGYDANGNAISAEGLGFAIPINEAVPIITELKDKGYVERPVLGVTGGFLSEEGAAYYRCPVGFVVQRISKGSGAEAAGMQSMDVITAIDGTSLTSYAQMSELITSHKIGDTIKVTLWRDGETLDLTVTLGSSQSVQQEETTTTTPAANDNLR